VVRFEDSERVKWSRARVHDALAEYRQALAAAEAACTELLSGELPEPDGSLAYRNALVAERIAMKAYTTAVRDLTNTLSERQQFDDDSAHK
jgi:hypothetical protein